MKRFLTAILGVGILMGPIGCTTTLPLPTEESVSEAAQQWPGTTLASLQQGRHCYADTCAACHNLHLPSEFPPERWEKIVERMQVKAHINDAKKDLILHYLLVASAQEVSK